MAGVPSLTLQLFSLKEQEYALVAQSEDLVAARQALAKQAASFVSSSQEYAGNDVVVKNLELKRRRFEQMERQIERIEYYNKMQLQIVRTRLSSVQSALDNRIKTDFTINY